MSYKIKVNQESCIGCEICASICPETFEIKEDKSYAKKEKIENLKNEKEAEEACPTQSITIEEIKEN